MFSTIDIQSDSVSLDGTEADFNASVDFQLGCALEIPLLVKAGIDPILSAVLQSDLGVNDDGFSTFTGERRICFFFHRRFGFIKRDVLKYS